MSYLHEYQTFLRILFAFGMCPFIVNKSRGRVQCDRITFGYNIAYLLLVMTLTTILLRFRAKLTFSVMKSSATIEVTTDFTQICICFLLFCAAIIILLSNHKSHEALLNGIVELDCKITREIGLCQIDKRSFFQRNFLENMSLLVIFTALGAICDTLLPDVVSTATNATLYKLWYIMMASMLLIILHIRSSAQILHARFALISKHFSYLSMVNANRKHYFNTFDLLDDWMELRRIFSNVFGPILLLNNTFDMSVMVVSIYTSYLMWINRGLVSPLLIILLDLSYTWWSMTKFVLLVTALDPFCEQVSHFILSN